MSKTAAIIGAGGLVGSQLLNLLLNSDEYSHVIALLRKPLAVEHPKLEQRIVDFALPDSYAFRADDVFSCLGTTITIAKTKENFKSIDYGIPLSVAQKAKEGGSTGFFLVSAMGADAGSGIFYSRVKGELDEAVKKLQFAKTGIFRPSMLLGQRKEFRFGELIGKKIMQGLRFLIPDKYKGIQAEQVAKAMLHLAISGENGCHVIENGEMLKF
jgi:uncharacterized protein YbjT (DUF2867 family)